MRLSISIRAVVALIREHSDRAAINATMEADRLLDTDRLSAAGDLDEAAK
jgi:hypothetical protein